MKKKKTQDNEDDKQPDRGCDEKRGKEDICCICGRLAKANINGKDYCIKCFPARE